ncbi:MAG TPA: restriction endonuclease subunit S, partial [bacterium]|nr:restriction endonuclease subunit S [bacterium]
PEGLVPKDYNTYQIFEKDDLVFKLIDLENYKTSRVGLVHKRGIMSSAYIRLILLNNNHPKYHYYLYFSWYLSGVYNKLGAGVRSTLSSKDLLELSIQNPPLSEQTQIAKFLDWKLSQINKFIKAKKRMIELLKEQKQVIINDAVTGKIDVSTGKPYPKYKDSGVEWLGKVPEGWEVLPIRRLTKFVKTGGTPKNTSDIHFSENGFDWFTPSDLGNSIFIKNSERKLSEIGLKEVKIFPQNSIYFVGIGATIGKIGICKSVASCNQQINVMAVNDKISSQFFVICLISMKTFILKCGKYTTLPIINQDDMKQLKLPVPNITNQEQICKYIDSRTTNADKIITHTEREIALIQEYRDRLISDA